MRTHLAAALSACAALVPAQQSTALFDAPVLAFDNLAAVHSLADLDGDGDLDGLGWWWTRGWPGGLTVRGFANDGRGAFTESFRYDQTVPASLYWAMDTGRFNNDSNADFVAWFDRTLEVRTMVNRVPTLYARVTTSYTPNEHSALAVADFDGDGLDDIAIAENGTRLFLNTGAGLQEVSSLANGAFQLHVAELDGDGRPDLLTVDFAHRYETAFFRGGVLVAGTALDHGVLSGSGVTKMTVPGDIDGDGDDDIVTFSSRGDYRVLRRTGAQTFTLESSVQGGPATGLADVDGDGDLDGVCCGGGGNTPYWNAFPSTFHIALNDGSGTFAPAWTIPNVGARRLAGAADIDGDGDTDLVAGRGILFNQDSFAREPQPLLALGPNYGGYRLRTGDLDGDLDLDAVPAGGSGLQRVRMFRNDGTGALTEHIMTLPKPAEGVSYGGPGWRGDFDGDGDPDVIVAEFHNALLHGMRLMLDVGNGEFTIGGWAAFGQTFNTSGNQYWFGPGGILADLDADRDLDLFFGGTAAPIWLNDGAGHFTQRATLSETGAQRAVDIDGDGMLDLLARNVGEIRVHWGQGDGTFAAPTTITFGETYDGGRVGTLDFDGDGDLELCAVGSRSVYSSLFVNQGDRTFVEQQLRQARTHTAGSSGRHVFEADLDADGHTDLVLHPGEGSYTASWVLRGNGTSGFETPVLQVFEAVGIDDMDGDGDLDVLTSTRMVRGTRWGGVDAGSRRQYGTAGVGAGGFAPTFGASGPFRAGETIEVALRGGPGGGLVSWVFAGAPGPLADWPFPGMTSYANPVLLAVPFALSGSAGSPGTGALRARVKLPPNIGGATLYQQVHLLDATMPYQFNWTAGLELQLGRQAL